MASGHPDFVSEVTTTLAEAGSFRGGADAAKPASPVAKDIYLATDTKILYVCIADGSWTGFDFAMMVQGILTLYADLAGGGFEIENIADPTAAQSAATRAYVLAQVAAYLLLAGGTMSGAIAMGTNKITGLGDPTAAQDAATKAYADTKLANVVEDTTPQLGGNLDAQSNQINNLPAPSAANDAARKAYVDTVDAKLDDVTQAQPTRVLGTTYQNTGGKIRIVTVTLDQTSGSNFVAECAAASPPTTVVASDYGDGLSVQAHSFTFVVVPNYYYRVRRTSGADGILYWTEWDLH